MRKGGWRDRQPVTSEVEHFPMKLPGTLRENVEWRYVAGGDSSSILVQVHELREISSSPYPRYKVAPQFLPSRQELHRL
jgi:hypothetical protein